MGVRVMYPGVVAVAVAVWGGRKWGMRGEGCCHLINNELKSLLWLVPAPVDDDVSVVVVAGGHTHEVFVVANDVMYNEATVFVHWFIDFLGQRGVLVEAGNVLSHTILQCLQSKNKTKQ